MRYCETCRVHVRGRQEQCPLCQRPLDGIADQTPAIFPDIPPAKKAPSYLIRLIAFATLIAAAVCIIINVSLPAGGWWSAFVVAGLISLWLSFAMVVKKRDNIPKSILWQVTIISALAIVWDLCTGFHRWSVDYVLPILCACAMGAMATIAQLMKLAINDYLIYLVLDAVLGIIPLILLLCGVLSVTLPSVICIAVSVISIAALFLFAGPALRADIARRLHL